MTKNILSTLILCGIFTATQFSYAQTSKKDRTARGIAKVEKMLAQARDLYDNLEYESVVPLTKRVLLHKSTNSEQRVRAYWLRGSSMVVIGRDVDAEMPFRLLLRIDPEFDRGDETPPRILAVFRKVQVEEKKLQEKTRALQIEKAVRKMKLTGAQLDPLVGGQPVEWELRLADRSGMVDRVEVHYRRKGEKNFNTLSLADDPETGLWVGDLTGEWTENSDGFTLEYFVLTRDEAAFPLLSEGDKESPLVVDIAPGVYSSGPPLIENPWLWVGVSLGGLALIGGGVVAGVLLTAPQGGDPAINGGKPIELGGI